MEQPENNSQGGVTQVEKPPMSQTEASWHETQAGNRAKELAQQEGANPEAVNAVLDASTEPLTVAGFQLKPASQGTIFTLQAVARAFVTYAEKMGMESTGDTANPGEQEMYESALAGLIFADGRRVSQKLKTEGIEAVVAEADELIWNISLEDARLISEHSNNELRRSNLLSGAAEISDADTLGKHHSPAQNSSAH